MQNDSSSYQFEIFRYEVLIKEHHLDTFGHMNNATYLELFEEARWDFITANGFGLEVIKSSQTGPVVLQVELKFKKEIKNREKIEIVSQCTGFINPLVMELKQTIIKEDGSLACEAKFRAGLMDMQQRKLMKPTDLWLKAIGVKGE